MSIIDREDQMQIRIGFPLGNFQYYLTGPWLLVQWHCNIFPELIKKIDFLQGVQILVLVNNALIKQPH